MTSREISCVPIPTEVTARIESKMGAGAVILSDEALTLSAIDAWAD
jgi:hypothetical protein